MRLFLLVVFLAAGVHPGVAQTTMGTITGVVRDTSQSVIPNVAVAATNVATGLEAKAVTSGTGDYAIPNLPIGEYDISISQAGFKGWKRPNIPLSAGEVVRVDATLEVGQANESVVVTAQAPALRTESTEVSATIDRHLSEQLPIPMAGVGGGMRNAFNLMMMLPEVKSNDGQTAGDDFQIGGGQRMTWSVAVDGAPVEMGYRNATGYVNRLTPPVDAVEEFRVETSSAKAESAFSTGGGISLTTKSGTNQLHGSAFDFYQSQKFSANTWSNNKLGRAKSIFHRNDFGGSAGGPVYIPKVYNGRNKTFFFFAYEGYRFPSTAGASELTIPSSAMRQGDFSEYKFKNGTLIPIYDPSTTTLDSTGKYVRTAFPGNRIPSSQLSSISKNIAAYYPAPNQVSPVRPTDQYATGIERNYLTPGNLPQTRIEDAYSLKVDQTLSSSNRLAFTWSKNGTGYKNAYDTKPEDPLNWGGTLPYPLSGRQYYQGNRIYGYVFRLNDTHTLSPTIINTLTLGFHQMRFFETDITSAFGTDWGKVLGGIGNDPYNNHNFPAINFTDSSPSWDSTKLSTDHDNVWTAAESISMVRGSHNVKFGYNYQGIFWNPTSYNANSGQFSFDRRSTSVPTDNSRNSGSDFASFMLGEVYQGIFGTPLSSARKWDHHALFVQDDWRISSRLTANIGLRYQWDPGVTERYDQFSMFDPNLPNPAASGYPGALRFLGTGPGRDGTRNLFNTAHGWAPRAGLAYQLTPKTVIRAGAAIFYAIQKAPGFTFDGFQGAADGFFFSSTWASPDAGITPAFNWKNGFPAWTAPPSINPSFNAGKKLDWFDKSRGAVLPSSDTWNLAISRVLKRDFVLDLTYSGSKGTHLASALPNPMQIDGKYAYLGNLLNRPIDDPAVVALGFKPPFANFKQLMGNAATLGQSLRMFPQYQNIVAGGTMDSSGNSTYHALMIQMTKRFSDGLSLLATYQWSKILTDTYAAAPEFSSGNARDNNNRGLDKSYGDIDQPHTIKITASYDLPFGRGKKFMNSGILGWIAGPWNLATFINDFSGTPLSVTDPTYDNYLFGGTAYPNVLSHNWMASCCVGDSFNPDVDPYLTKTPFVSRTNPAIDPFGNAPRYNGKARRVRTVRENITVARSFPVWEKVRLDFRWEVYDLFNHKTWGAPGTNLMSSSFGLVTGASGNRSMQGGFKLIF
jgi:hypothetical protein